MVKASLIHKTKRIPEDQARKPNDVLRDLQQETFLQSFFRYPSEGLEGAIQRAGMSDWPMSKVKGMMRKKAFKARYGELMERSKEITQEKSDLILQRIEAFAFGTIKDVASWNNEGIDLKDSSTLTDAQAASIVKIEQNEKGAVKVETLNGAVRMKALEMLGKKYGVISTEDEAGLSGMGDPAILAQINIISMSNEEIKKEQSLDVIDMEKDDLLDSGQPKYRLHPK